MGRKRTTTIALICAYVVAASNPALANTEHTAPSTGRDTLLTGIYSDQWQAGQDISSFSASATAALSLAGTFHRLRESEDGWGPGVTDRLLEQVWSAATTPVANVNVSYTAYEVARGDADADIGRWAARVRAWLDRGEGRSLLIAPMQEMNGNWVPYGMDPGNYRIAFRRFVEIARYYGLDETRTRWVFAPNGWSVPPYAMADYYPGDDIVDFVGVSAYNFGAQVDMWTPVAWAVNAALDEVRTFAPDKPYVLAQVGSSTSGGDRDEWIRDLFRTATRDPNVVGLVWFNFDKETDWKVWDGTSVAIGWNDASSAPTVRHVWPLSAWFEPGPLHFQAHEGRFADDDMLPARRHIDWLAELGIVTGCDANRFCPDRVVSRAELATLLARTFGLSGSAGAGPIDVAEGVHADAIRAVMAAGLMDGCDPKRFCPDAPATRDVLRNALGVATSSVTGEETFTPTPDVGKADPICPTARHCQKKSLTRTYVAAALGAVLKAGPVPPDEPAPARWWLPTD
jgi:hypothetical protein